MKVAETLVELVTRAQSSGAVILEVTISEGSYFDLCQELNHKPAEYIKLHALYGNVKVYPENKGNAK